MDDYFVLTKKLEKMLPEERMRWELENDCTCHVVEYWWNPIEHFGDCPRKNPDAEIWRFFESVEEGYYIPKSHGETDEM